jgi:hypothetical protein
VATHSETRAAVRFFGMGRRDTQALAERLREAKIATYTETLHRQAQQLGSLATVDLSPQVLGDLGIEATQHAQSIARTFNRDLARYAARISSGIDKQDLRSSLRAWSENRNMQRAPVIAATEVYGPHADATMAFFMELGLLDSEFDFGGHPEDDPPVCEICAALVATNPHPLKEVIRIGTPHPRCAQNWHWLGDSSQVPGHVEVGGQTAGIVGGKMLVQRAGSRAAAVEQIISGALR